MAPKDIRTLFPGIRECITLNGKRDFRDALWVKDLEMGVFPGSSGWAQAHESLKEESLSCRWLEGMPLLKKRQSEM